MLKLINLLVLALILPAVTHNQAAARDKTGKVHLVSKMVGKDFLSETIRIGDLNGDGAPDILFVQNLYGPRIITCLTATTLAGEILWQTGTPSKDNGRIYCDLPVQIYDWDHDGTNEVLHVRQAQHVVAGRFRTDSPLQVMAVDRTPVPTHRRDANAWAILYLYDLEGRELWHRQMEKGEWCIAARLIQWLGPGQPDCALVYGQSVERQGPPKPACIYNGQGEVIAELPLQIAGLPGEKDFWSDCYGMAADVWGDAREEVILFGSRGFCVYANTQPLDKPSLNNMTLYPGL
jgi:hypothetical protein